MSTLKNILEQRGMPCCSGCGTRMKMMEGACPDCGVNYGLSMGAKDAPGMSEAKTEEEPTADFKLDKLGRKIKASKIVFNQGEDDSTKRVQEDMKTTYKDMITAYSAIRVESLQLEDEINEVLSKDAAAGDWISDFVHSDNPKFAGKSKEKRKQMALAAYYAKQKNEEVVDESRGFRGVDGRRDREDDEGYSRTKEADDAHNRAIDAAAKARALAAKAPKNTNEEVDESTVPAHMKGKQKPYVSSSGGDHEVLGNVGQVKATFTQKEHGKEAKAKAIAHLKKNYDTYMKEEIELNEATVGQIAQAHGFQKQTSGASKGSYKHPKTGETITALRDQTFGHSTNDGGTIASFKHKNSLEKHLADKGYKKAVSEEVEEMDEAEYKISTAQMGHAGKTTIKHIKNPDVTQRMAAHDVKSYADRIALLKDAKRKGNLKEEEMNEELHPDADKVLKHIKPEHHAKYTPDLTTKHYTGNYADRTAVLKAAEHAGHLKESAFDWKNAPREKWDKTKTSTYHDVKKISTGTVYTKQFDKDGTSKGTGDDAAKKAEGAAKRGRGRPKKDKFAESVEILMSLSEEQFDSMMEDGFDTFFEAYEQLDEASKAALKSCGKSTK